MKRPSYSFMRSLNNVTKNQYHVIDEIVNRIPNHELVLKSITCKKTPSEFLCFVVTQIPYSRQFMVISVTVDVDVINGEVLGFEQPFDKIVNDALSHANETSDADKVKKEIMENIENGYSIATNRLGNPTRVKASSPYSIFDITIPFDEEYDKNPLYDLYDLIRTCQLSNTFPCLYHCQYALNQSGHQEEIAIMPQKEKGIIFYMEYGISSKFRFSNANDPGELVNMIKDSGTGIQTKKSLENKITKYQHIILTDDWQCDDEEKIYPDPYQGNKRKREKDVSDEDFEKGLESELLKRWGMPSMEWIQSLTSKDLEGEIEKLPMRLKAYIRKYLAKKNTKKQSPEAGGIPAGMFMK